MGSSVRECPLTVAPASLRGSEVIRVREEAPPVRSGEQLVARPGISDHLRVCVQRIPVHGREDGVLAEVASVDLDRPPLLSVRRAAIGGDGRSEVIPHRAVVRHVDRLAPTDRNERPETEARHTFHIAFRVAAGAAGRERIERAGPLGTVAAAAAPANPEYGGRRGATNPRWATRRASGP